jgi:hypothetical protein
LDFLTPLAAVAYAIAATRLVAGMRRPLSPLLEERIVDDPFVMTLIMAWGIALPAAVLAFIDWWIRRKEQRSKNQR